MNIYEQIKKNNFNTWVILTVFVALLLAIEWGLTILWCRHGIAVIYNNSPCGGSTIKL